MASPLFMGMLARAVSQERSAQQPRPSQPQQPRPQHGGQATGPRGGTFYVSASGQKVYHDSPAEVRGLAPLMPFERGLPRTAFQQEPIVDAVDAIFHKR